MKILKAAYPPPCDEGPQKSLRTSMIVGIFIFLFLLFFRPFGMDGDLDLNMILIVLGYGFISFVICAVFLTLIPSQLPGVFSPQKWMFYKSILYISFMILFIGLANVAYTSIVFVGFETSLEGLLYTIGGTFLIGIMPTVFFLARDLNLSEKKFIAESKELVGSNAKATESGVELVFESQYDEPSFSCKLEDLCFIEADGNYITIVTKSEKRMLRNSLKYALSICSPHDNLVQTHRSFISNLNNVQNAEGNAQGYSLYFESIEAIARVSRSKTKEVKAFLHSIRP